MNDTPLVQPDQPIPYREASPPPVRAIEVTWAGIRYRSTCEARWAVFFGQIELEFEYEAEGYRLPLRNYLPDFWFPYIRMFGEVKGGGFSQDEIQLCRELADATDRPVLLLDGLPTLRNYDAIHPADPETPDAHFECNYSLDIWRHDYRRQYLKDARLWGCLDPDEERAYGNSLYSSEYKQAVLTARSHRFYKPTRQ